MRHFISLFDISQEELRAILTIGEQVKALLRKGSRPAWLSGHVLAMLFEKPSLRTRVSFETGISHFGGSAMFLGQEVGWQSRESTADFIRVLAEYTDFVVCRSKLHQSVLDLAQFNCVPIINGLTDLSHPCQALADLMTMRQVFPDLTGKQITFVGDGNNVSRSLALASAMTGVRFRLLGPTEYFMTDDEVGRIKKHYPQVDIVQTDDPKVALAEADFVYTDVWTSMGQEAESEQRRKDFADFQLNGDLLRIARPDCRVLHCLPAKRGEEITDEVMDCSQSMVIDQAGNRLHAQKGLILWLALQHGMLEASQLQEHGISW